MAYDRKVFVVASGVVFGDGVRLILEREGYEVVVVEREKAMQKVPKLSEHGVKVAIVGARRAVAETGEEEVVDAIKKVDPNIRVIVLSTLYVPVPYADAFFQTGVSARVLVAKVNELWAEASW